MPLPGGPITLHILLRDMIGTRVLSSCENTEGALWGCRLLQVDHRARDALGRLQLCRGGVGVGVGVGVMEWGWGGGGQCRVLPAFERIGCGSRGGRCAA